MIAMAIESAMIPLPSELILPLAGFMVSDPTKIEPLTGQPWNFWIVVIVATIGNTLGSLIAYAIGACGGRPFLERYGKYMLIREHELEAADHFFARYGAATVFIGRLLPIVRTFISFPAGVARMPIGKFIVYSTLGALLWSIAAGLGGRPAGHELGDDPGHAQAVRPGDRRRAWSCCSWACCGGGWACPDARRRRPPPDQDARRRLTPSPRACPGGPRRCARSLRSSSVASSGAPLDSQRSTVRFACPCSNRRR